MKKYSLSFIFLALLILSFQIIDKRSLRKVSTNDDYNFIAINNILMWIANNGDGSHDPNIGGNGFYWPGGKDATQSAIFEDGFLFGGIVDGDVRVGGSTYRQGLQAGKILKNGEADDPSLEKYRVYKIRKDWRDLQPGENLTQEEIDQYQRDYDEWPVEDGAPWIDVDGDGIFTRGIDEPKHEGDETLWFVANDFDPARTKFLYGKQPLGIEMQATVFGFDSPGLKDVVFKKYLLINRGQNDIKDMHIAMWSDPDLGQANDDYSGCDTSLDLAFAWNADNFDDIYGIAPPAVGYQLLQGPVVKGNPGDSAYFFNGWHPAYKNLPMTAFIMYICASSDYSGGSLGQAQGSIEMYNNMQGKLRKGNPIVNPLTNQTTKFALDGDPVKGTGWYEGAGWDGGARCGDRDLLTSSGPFDLSPGDSQEVVIAINIAKGSNYIDSVSRLRYLAHQTRLLFNKNFEPLEKITIPLVKTISADQKITLYWDDKAETYNTAGYRFEGYHIYQFLDKYKSDSTRVATFDNNNDINRIWDYREVDGELHDTFLEKLPNSGLEHTITITIDAFSGEALLNGSAYYFSVCPFAYNPAGYFRLLESGQPIIKAIPGEKHPDLKLAFDANSLLNAQSVSGFGDGLVGLRIIDPLELNGHTYKVTFDTVDWLQKDGTDEQDFVFNFIDTYTADTLCQNYIWSSDEQKAEIIADSFYIDLGLRLILSNTGLDSLGGSLENNAIKEVVEIKGPDGISLDMPLNVLDGQLNSTGQWSISADGDDKNRSSKENINWRSNAGRACYEIRFTTKEAGSQYYLTGRVPGFFSTAPLKSDPKATDKIPFEIWTLGEDLDSENDDQRLIIKILDNNNFDSTMAIPDARWSQFPEDDSLRAGQWERIFAYYPVDSIYPEVLPEWSGLSNRPRDLHKIGQIIITGEIPEPGTVVQIDTWRPLSPADTFVVTATAPIRNDYAAAKKRLDDISVFPNPYFGADPFGRFPDRNYVRFTNLPAKVTVRIFTLSGQLVSKIEKDSASPWLDWDLRNINGKAVASGIYIAHLEMPRIGKKIMKLALVKDND